MAFCFDNYGFMTIEVFLLFVVFLSVTSNFIGELEINWRLTYEINHVLYIIDFIISFVTLLVLASFICLRDKNQINSVSNRFCIYATYYLFIINSIRIISLCITFYQIYLDFNDFDKNYANRIGKDSNYLSTVGQWAFLFGSMISNFIFNVLLFPMLHSILLRLTGRLPDKIKYTKVSEKNAPTELTQD